MKRTSGQSLDRLLATVCETCPLCRQARRRQAGAAYRFVQRVERRLCPFCRAYRRVHGQRSFEPVPGL